MLVNKFLERNLNLIGMQIQCLRVSVYDGDDKQ